MSLLDEWYWYAMKVKRPEVARKCYGRHLGFVKGESAEKWFLRNTRLLKAVDASASVSEEAQGSTSRLGL